MFKSQLVEKSSNAIEFLREKGMTISTAESCTGGLIIGLLTEISGSSAVVDRGFITYTNRAKMDMVGVKAKTLKEHGAVSAQTVKEMAIGAKKYSGSRLAVSVSGIAGPTGGSDDKPVGLVHWALAHDNGVITESFIFKGSRSEVRLQAIEAVLDLILKHTKAV
tara:strand:- start:74511 stop:75002 length:492 start_codon:yes stop_codon:yes gene_type:complete